MAEKQDTGDETEKKPSKLPLIIGLVLAIAGAGGAFFAVYSGLILGDPAGESQSKAAADGSHGDDGHGGDDHDGGHGGGSFDTAFVEVEPMIISIGTGAQLQHLRFRAQLEVDSAHRAEVEHLLPRVVDVLNGFLRALELSDITDRAALVKLRAQMLRRVQVVTGPDMVNDLLVMEFVLN